MSQIVRLESVYQFNTIRGQKTLHPMVTLLDQSKSKPIDPGIYLSDLYIVFFKDVRCESFKYGKSKYDHQEESLVFIGPGQTFGLEPGTPPIQPNGWALAFHPDFIASSSIFKNISNYSFFAYDINEALHVSEREKNIIVDCFKKILDELKQNTDAHSKVLILSYIELLLNYCVRFYERQFIMRKNLNTDILVQFENLLNEYFTSDLILQSGMPTVKYCASRLHLSPNYFGDLIKKETGITAQEFIHKKLIQLARIKVSDTTQSISEIAYSLGFKYPSHFTKLFKQHVGKTPNEFRVVN